MFKETRRPLKLRKDARLRDLSGARELKKDELELAQGGFALCLCVWSLAPAPLPEPEPDDGPSCD